MLQRFGRPVGWWTIVAVLVLTGATTRADLTLHDLAGRARGDRPTRHAVILVAIDTESLGALGPLPWAWTDLDRLIAPVLAASPPAIGLLPYPDQLFPDDVEPEGALADAIADGRVVLASRLVTPEGASLPSATPGLTGTPAESLVRGARTAVRQLQPDRGGRVRRQTLAHATTTGTEPAIEALLLTDAGHDVDRLADPLGISFVGRPGEIAHVSAIKCVRGEIESKSFADRAVLIGVTTPGMAQRFSTPTSPGPRLMTAAEVHASALATVLDGRRVREWWWLGLLLLAPLALLSDLLVRRVDMLVATVRSVLLTLVALAMVTAASLALDLRLPVVGAILVVAGPVALEAAARATRTRRRVRQLLVDLSHTPTFRTSAGSARQGEQFWNYLAVFLAQFTGIDRVVVGEREGRAHVYEWRGAHGVELEEVRLEATAVRKLRLQRSLLEGRPAVLAGEDWSGHDELLALPLGTGDEIHALALLVTADAGHALRSEGARLVAGGAVGGRMVEQRRSTQAAIWSSMPRSQRAERRRSGQGLAGPFRRLGVDHQVDIAGVLTRLVLDDRQQFRGILQALPVGTLFADMMGEVQLINDAARRVLEASSYHFFPGANLPTLIGELTGRPAEEISAALFATYTTDEPSVFRWETTGAAPRTFRMPVRPVADARADQENDDDQSSIRPTPLGYLCVIEDVTASRDAQRGMLTVLDTLTRRAEGHVSSLHRVGKMLLAQADLPLESAGHVSQMLTQADVLVGLIEEFASALGPVEGSDTGVIPVDPAELAAAVVDEVGGAMSAEHRLKLRVHGPITPVLMDRTRLARGLYRILYDSLINSPADAVTTIEVTEDRSGVFLEVRDEGYGIPDAVLKQLDADSDHPVDPADGLARVVRDVRVGGGQLAIDSRVGRGTSYRIRFSKRVKVSDLPTGPGSDDP